MRFGVRRLLRGGRPPASQAALLAAVVGIVLAAAACGSGTEQSAGAGTLRQVMGDQHAHSLKVDPGDPDALLLGLHGGLYRSTDAGRSWRLAGLDGDDAMNVVGDRGGAPLWVTGHNVLERSLDGGKSFDPVRPRGLPSLDLHGFAVREGKPSEIYAAAAGEGLYRSEDGGDSFELVSRTVGPSAFGLAERRDGTLFISDPGQGFLISGDGGRSFRMPLRGQGLVSVAIEPGGRGLVVVGGEPGLYLSRDGGRRFEEGFTDAAVAAVAIAPSDPKRVYAVGSDGTVFVSDDGARTWSQR
jgi:photosystem II stability/assembly factor-like uncharacterized protein